MDNRRLCIIAINHGHRARAIIGGPGTEGGGDVADGLPLLLLGVVGGEGSGATAWEERADAAAIVGRRGCGRGFGGEGGGGVAGATLRGDVDLLVGDRAVHADLAGGDAEGLVAKPVGGEDVDGAEDAGKDAGGDDDAPEGGAEGVFGGGGFVEVAEDGDADDDHEDAEGNEAGAGGEEGPVGCCVAFEEADFGE